MKEIDFIPSQQTAESPFVGKIRIKIPSYKERLELIKKMQFKVGADGAMEARTEKIDSAVTVVDMLSAHVTEVDLKLKDGGDEIKSLDDLGYYVEGGEVINQLANILLSGIRLGKS